MCHHNKAAVMPVKYQWDTMDYTYEKMKLSLTEGLCTYILLNLTHAK